ncbi:hypothetical protein CEXT_73471 [Caerostris extrusa]|uniref:Maturase K n=1 Tax=Caerostris extrusa TaxID=172846 RepID=A0AAV4NA88_CAEEX|nr:hypothetical protein CEXT_73471 [Caerostris extrusa]
MVEEIGGQRYFPEKKIHPRVKEEVFGLKLCLLKFLFMVPTDHSVMRGGRQPHPIVLGDDSLYLHSTLISQLLKRFNFRCLYASIPNTFGHGSRHLKVHVLTESTV